MAISEEQYIRLETFKKNGQPAATPVWVADMQGELVVVTDADSYKAKRLRRDERVRVTGCNASGKRTHGPTLEGRGEVMEDPDYCQRAVRTLKAKYGVKWTLIELFHKLAGHKGQRCVLRLTLQA